ncbi:MAG: hypothetical protein OXN27_04530 [Candidatus Poribacteria bacterium]|nr:hypothetical protein [Candidatus Poribacteria bacterium]
MLTLLLSRLVNAAFENIELMAGPAGMGGAYSAATQDTSALIWNPAGLAGLSTPEIAIGYLDLHGVLGYSFVGVAHPIRKGRSVGAAILNSSDTEGISHERIVLLSAATRVWKRFHIGLNAKYFSTSVNLEQVPLGSGRGWGTDLGIQYALMTDRVRIGVVFPNLFSNLSYRRLKENTTGSRYEEPLLREWRVGTAVKVNFGSGTPDSLLAAVEIANGIPLIGCEYQHNVKHGDFAFRLGWRFTRGFTAGFGYQHGNIGLDYAFVNERYGSQTSLFSVRLFY